MEAACTQQIDMMQYLLQRGADLTSRDCGANALVDAAQMGHEDVIRVLVEAGIDVNGDGRASHFSSAVLSAKIGRQTSTVDLLFALRARDVDPLTTHRRTQFLDGRYPCQKPPPPLLRP